MGWADSVGGFFESAGGFLDQVGGAVDSFAGLKDQIESFTKGKSLPDYSDQVLGWGYYGGTPPILPPPSSAVLPPTPADATMGQAGGIAVLLAGIALYYFALR